MCTLGNLLTGGWLLFLSIWDIKRKELPRLFLGAWTFVLLLWRAWGQQMEAVLWLGGLALGLGFLLISRVSREELGYGDSIGIMNLGIYLGVWNLLELLFLAFSLIFLFSLALLLFRRKSRKMRLPLYPFFFLGYLLSFL